MSVAVRHPVVAGRFYPANPEVLRTDVQSYLSSQGESQTAVGCVVPHAGYIYSGHVAGAVFAHLQIPRCCLVMCPNHTGMGRPLAIMSQGTWETPLGPVAIDSELAETLKQEFPLLTEDAAAHRAEHAVEVQLPFLQARRSQFTFVPIALGTGEFDALEALGIAIAEVAAAQKEPMLIIASSDMNHYESDQVTREKDRKAIDRMLALDPRGLFEVVVHEDISMCGFGPAVAMLTAARQMGASGAELLRYATSGDVSRDRNMVVGYAGLVVR